MVVLGLVAALAFALPALVLLARLPRSVCGGRAVRFLASGLVSLALINLVTVVWGRAWDSTGWFVGYNLAFVAMTGAAASGLVWARQQAGRPLGSWLIGTLAATAGVAWLSGLWVALVAPGGSPWAVFAAGTLWSTAVVLVAVSSLIPTLRRLRGGPLARALVGGSLVAVTLVLSLANELGGPHVPLSGVWLAGFASVVYVVAYRWLRLPEAPEPAETWARQVGLSVREREVLQTLLANPDRTAAAEALFISPVTLKNHLASLYRRTGVSDLSSLLALARSHGWNAPDQPR